MLLVKTEMKHRSNIAAFVILILTVSNIAALGFSFRTANANSQNTTTIKFLNIGGGQTTLTNETTHTSLYVAKLEIPSAAPEGSGCMVLYPYNKTLNSLQSFQVCTSYQDAVPRFVLMLDTNADGLTDVVLLSDYQFSSDGSWQATQGGQRWGWTEANSDLSAYGTVWNSSSYWKSIYGNATVLSVGVALEYWAVRDSNGLGQPLYADELTLNGVTYNIANQTGSQQPDNWSMYRHDLQGSGFSSSAAPSGNLIWQFFTGPSNSSALALADRLRASPTIVDGVVYFGSNSSYFYALNATNGSTIWQVNVGCNVESSAAVVNNVVYVGILWDGHNGYVNALNAKTGALIWRFATNSGIESSPAVNAGVVYIGSYSGYVYALNASNGVLLWSYLTGGSTFSSPAIVGGIVYIGSNDGKLYALNANNGAPIWSFQTGDPIYSSPAVVNNAVYFNTDNGTVYALRANDGSKIWQATIGMGDHADDSPAVANGIVYVGARNGYYALNASNGYQIWSFTSPYSQRELTGYVYSSPAVADGVVYFGSWDGYLFAVGAFDGSLIWSYQTGGFLFSSPTLANGVVYIGSYDGYVYALGGTNSSTPTPIATPQPIPTPSPTTSPSPTTAPTNTTSSWSSTTISTPVSTLVPSQMPASTGQPRIAVNAAPNENINWGVLGGTVIILLATLSVIVFVFIKKPLET